MPIRGPATRRGRLAQQPREHAGLRGAGDEPEAATRPRQQRQRQRHAPIAALYAGDHDVAIDRLERGVAGEQRRGVAVVAETEVHEIGHRGRTGHRLQHAPRRRARPSRGRRRIRPASRAGAHGGSPGSAAASRCEVARRAAGRCNALVDLEHHSCRHGSDMRAERFEHRRGEAPPLNARPRDRVRATPLAGSARSRPRPAADLRDLGDDQPHASRPRLPGSTQPPTARVIRSAAAGPQLPGS